MLVSKKRWAIVPETGCAMNSQCVMLRTGGDSSVAAGFVAKKVTFRGYIPKSNLLRLQFAYLPYSAYHLCTVSRTHP